MLGRSPASFGRSSMLIDWSYLAPALVLLLLPSGLFAGHGMRGRSISRDFSGQWFQLLAHPRHLVDLLRAAGGGWLLARAVTATPGAEGMARNLPVLVQGPVLLASVTLQTIVCRERDAFHAPFAFVFGLVAGFVPALAPGWLPPAAAALSLVAASAIAMGAHAPAAFFIALPPMVVGLGVLFMKVKYAVVLAPVGVAASLPWVLALLFGRELVLMNRLPPAHDAGSRLRG